MMGGWYRGRGSHDSTLLHLPHVTHVNIPSQVILGPCISVFCGRGTWHLGRLIHCLRGENGGREGEEGSGRRGRER